ncbi:hypothetical protein PYCC9005_002236 [Savitreella phatthalungensis]
MSSSWSPASWRAFPVKQDVIYQDADALKSALTKLSALPPLVTAAEIDRLRDQLEDVALGKAFLLQGGDCAESFDDCGALPIEAKVKVLLQMSLILLWGARVPVVRIARMAGQYAKPRSSPTEEYQGQTIPSFRGHNVNGHEPTDRTPDPARLVSAYFHSAATLNYLRSLLTSGFADLHNPEAWNLDWVRSSHAKQRYSEITGRLLDCLSFMQTIGADRDASLRSADIFTSHEGLMLEYEETLTREGPKPLGSRHRGGDTNGVASTQGMSSSGFLSAPGSLANSTVFEQGHYNLGAHFLWVGDRTRQLDGAHIEYFRGIKNPIGLKVGPSMTAAELVRALDILDPLPVAGSGERYRPGKVTLIARYGAARVQDLLPAHIQAVQGTAHKVVWACDPMHGNTRSSTTHPELKTRLFDDILLELTANLDIHAQHNSLLTGVHFEMTGEAVTECMGGRGSVIAQGIDRHKYQTFCDPRLNYEQSIELAFLIATHWRQQS